MEGKLGNSDLKDLIPKKFGANSGIVIGPGLGIDAAAIDFEIAVGKALKYYNLEKDSKWYFTFISIFKINLGFESIDFFEK